MVMLIAPILSGITLVPVMKDMKEMASPVLVRHFIFIFKRGTRARALLKIYFNMSKSIETIKRNFKGKY